MNFPGLAHRMQFVARKGAVNYINDSKATNVAAAVASINSIDGSVVLIAGGDGKGGDFTDLATSLEGKLRAAVLIGKDAEKIASAIDTVMPVYFAQDMDDAVGQAAAYAESDDTVSACAGLCEPRSVQELWRTRRRILQSGGGVVAMTVKSATMPFPARLRTEFKLDPVLLTIVMTLLLGGFVILASASITISDKVSGDPFFYVERQLVAAIIGAAAGLFCLFVPMRVWQSISPLLLLVGLALLFVVLIPGVGYEVNGSTRWVRFGIMNLQVSEPARLCLLVYVAGYVVRQQKALRERFVGFLRPMVVLSLACALLLAEPDFGAAIVLLQQR